MDKEKLYSILVQHAIEENYIEVRMEREILNCIPIIINNDMAMILRFFDFMPDGYTIIPMSQVLEIKYSESCKFFENIVKNEGITSFLSGAPEIEIISWEKVFSFFKKTKEIVIAEIGKEDSINIGRVVKVTKENLFMQCFSPVGIWDEMEWAEPFINITSITFRNHYTNIFSKYLQ